MVEIVAMRRYKVFNSNLWIILFLVSWAIYIFYPFSLSEPGISADGVTYVHIAKSILLDGSPGWQATWAAPFFSVLMAALYPLVGNFAVAGMVTSKIMTVLLPLSVYLLAKSIFNSKVGVISAILTAFHPHFTFISGSVEPEMAYTTLLVFSLWALWKTYNSGGQWSMVSGQESEEFPNFSTSQPPIVSRLTSHVSRYGWAILAGILSSLAYQTRSESLLIFVFAVTAMIVISFLKSRRLTDSPIHRFTVLTIVIVAFILTSLPYLIFLKSTYGKWVLSPKSSYVQIWMKWKIYHDNDLGEQGNPELWGLSKSGKLMWQEPKGIGNLTNYLMSHPEKNLRVYLLNFSKQIPGRIPNNSGQWLYPQVYPWYFVIPALFWIILSFIKKGTAITPHPSSFILPDRAKTLFLLSPFAILFVLPIFSDGWWKYLLPYSPFLIIFAIAGISYICERFNWRYLLPTFAVIIAIYSLWTVKASPLVKHGDRTVTARMSMLDEQKKAGEWAQKRFKGTPNYMVQWSKLAYYLNGRWTAMPVTTYDKMVWYARKNKVDYLVFETGGKGESEEIVRVFGNTPDLEIADVYESQTSDYGVVFLKFKK